MTPGPDEQPPDGSPEPASGSTRPTTGTPAPPPEHPHSARRWFLGALAAVLMLAAYFLLPLDLFGPHRPVVSWLLLVVLLGGAATLLVRQIGYVLVDRPGTHPGLAIILLMCLSVLTFSAAYYSLAKQPGQFHGLTTRLDALYFTVVTLATVGYGDITARGQTARGVVLVQIVYSFVFLTAAATSLTGRFRSQYLARPGHAPERRG